MLGTGITRQKALYFRDDESILNEPLEIKDILITRKNRAQHDEAWPYLPSLKKPITFKGKYRGEFYLVCSRTGEPLDPCGEMPEDWKGEKMLDRMWKIANEEHNRVVGKVHESATNKATVWLSVGAGIYTVLMGLSVLLGGL